MALGAAGLGMSACYIEGGVYTCFDDYDCPYGSYCGADGICYDPVVTTRGCFDDYDCANGYSCAADGARGWKFCTSWPPMPRRSIQPAPRRRCSECVCHPFSLCC